MLTAMAALVGLHWGEATAKRRQGRKKLAQDQTQGSTDLFTPALAAQPESLVIHTEKLGGEDETGTFEASGAFVDVGTFQAVDMRIAGLESERLLTNHLTYKFTGEGGTFQLTAQTRLMFGATGATSAGHWRVTGGTGDYAGLKGAGSLEGTLDFATGIFDLTFTGRVQLA